MWARFYSRQTSRVEKLGLQSFRFQAFTFCSFISAYAISSFEFTLCRCI